MDFEKIKERVGYKGKSQQWQYGFDLAIRELQQAQKVAVPEGFVLVSKDDLLTVLCNCSDAMGDESTSSVYDETGEPSTWYDHHVVAEKNILSSIPDAQEQVG